jgi:hypothetical protein
MREDIERFLAKKSKASIVLEMLLNREYVTCSDIINYGCEGLPIVFTTCPQNLIKAIRDAFGYDFVKDREVKFFRTFYNSKGKEYKQTDTYKQYFIEKCGA